MPTGRKTGKFANADAAIDEARLRAQKLAVDIRDKRVPDASGTVED